jgi:uncharacterized protein YnzC (UPF0291/DUF896 family)
MKDLNPESKIENLTEEIREVQEERKQTYIGSLKPHKGHKLYEIDIVLNTINEATFEKTEVVFNTKGSTPSSSNKKVVIKENCFYISALNKKNAIKKFGKKLENL